MTEAEAEARAALAAWDGVGGLEAWIAEQPWEAMPDGWRVKTRLQGWSFELQPNGNGLRIIASPGVGTAPAVWVIAPA